MNNLSTGLVTSLTESTFAPKNVGETADVFAGLLKPDLVGKSGAIGTVLKVECSVADDGRLAAPKATFTANFEQGANIWRGNIWRTDTEQKTDKVRITGSSLTEVMAVVAFYYGKQKYNVEFKVDPSYGAGVCCEGAIGGVFGYLYYYAPDLPQLRQRPICG